MELHEASDAVTMSVARANELLQACRSALAARTRAQSCLGTADAFTEFECQSANYENTFQSVVAAVQQLGIDVEALTVLIDAVPSDEPEHEDAYRAACGVAANACVAVMDLVIIVDELLEEAESGELLTARQCEEIGSL